MRGMERLIPDLEENDEDEVLQAQSSLSTTQWIFFGCFVIVVAILSLWALFQYVVFRN